MKAQETSATYYNAQPLPGISLREGRIRTRSEAASAWLVASVAGLLPVFFIPVAVDGFILPRAFLALVGGAAVFGAGLLWGRRSLGRLGPPAAAVTLAAVLAGALSIAPNLSLVGAYGRCESLPMRLAYVGLLCGAAWLGERQRVVNAFLAGCGLASLETVAQALMGALPRPDGNLGQPNLLGREGIHLGPHPTEVGQRPEKGVGRGAPPATSQQPESQAHRA